MRPAVIKALYRLEKPYRDKGQVGMIKVRDIARQSGLENFWVGPTLKALFQEGLCTEPYESGATDTVQWVNGLTERGREVAESLLAEE